MRQHQRHLAQIQAWLGRRKHDGTFPRKRLDAWTEVIRATQSNNDYVAIAACALLERAVLAVYERAIDHLWLNNTALQLLRRQRLVLKCCHARHLRRPRRESLEPQRARPAATRPASAFGTSLAVAAAS
jgi:hypothetical protein